MTPTPQPPPPQPQETPATPSSGLPTPTPPQTPPSSRPDTPAPSHCTPVGKDTSPYACCGIEVVKVKHHVRYSEVCLEFYRDKYGMQDIDRIFNIIKNQKKQAKRRNDREQGIQREDNERRGNYSIRTQKKHFTMNITSLFEKRCVFCQRYFLKFLFIKFIFLIDEGIQDIRKLLYLIFLHMLIFLQQLSLMGHTGCASSANLLKKLYCMVHL